MAVTVGLLAAHPSARAQDLNYQTFLVGQGALGFGGAFTAVASDPSGAFHNPGALPFAQSGAISGSTAVQLVNEYFIDAGFSGAALDFDGDTAIPFFLAANVSVGPKLEGLRRHGLAALTVVPHRMQRTFFGAAGGDASLSSLLIRSEDSTRWFGVSYGYRVNRHLGIGATLFVARRSATYEESALSGADGGTPDAALGRFDLTGWLGLARVGALIEFDEHWQVGAMFQLPSLHFAADATLSENRWRGGQPYFASAETAPEIPIPWQLRVGGLYRTDRFAISTELAVYGPLGSDDDPVRALGVDPTLTDNPNPGTYLAPSFRANAVVNASIGFATELLQDVPLRGGLFTNLSAAPSTPETAELYQPDRVEAFGATVAMGYQGSGFDFSVGLLGMLGFGTGLVADATNDGYRRAGVSMHSIHLFISGAGGTVGRLARVLADTVAPGEVESGGGGAPERDAPRSASPGSDDDPETLPGDSPEASGVD